MKSSFSLLFGFLLISHGSSAVITGACEMDTQCGGAMCCAVSLWIRSLRMCTPMGLEGDDCHPVSHKVPFFGKRLHHTCPCLPNLVCVRTTETKYKCLPPYKYQDYYL
ncbi:prokineticin-2 [Conger conger]|uniref:prokineticin-2 n=1 Tax=Conger conger TaxID=82655 RepID=UPI002A5A504E|nr:prokineticin-2 [Conger conger]